MRIYFVYLLIASLMIACSPEEKKPSAENSPAQTSENNTPLKVNLTSVKKNARDIGPEKPENQEAIEAAMEELSEASSHPLLGYWVGMFGSNKINIALTSADSIEVKGHSVCAGNYRALKGRMTKVSETIYEFNLKEPGDDKYDGEFKFTINTENSSLEGTWAPFNKPATSDKKYTLSKTTFAYNPQAGEYPTTSQKLLTEEDVSNFLPEELKIMRNEIYARHGYSFKTKDMRSYFDAQDWYIPTGIDVRDDLTDIEVVNIDMIYRYEEYYENSYDDYGR